MRYLVPKPALAAALLAAVLCASAPAAEPPYQETQQKKSWYTFLRPARDTPVEQLAYARGLRDRHHFWWAGRHYRALVASWPVSAEAPQAQYEYARLLEDHGAPDKAFDEYQTLIERYAGRFPFEEIVQRQYDLALHVMTRRHARILFGGWTTPERAIPLLEKLSATAPNWSKSAEARLQAGRCYEANGDYTEAALAYAETQYYHPSAAIAQESVCRRAICLYHMARQSRNDVALADEAWTTLNQAALRFPNDANAALTAVYRDETFRRRVGLAYNVARYYDRHGRTRACAQLAYERFLIRFPKSEWTPTVQRRLKELGAAKETSREENKSAE